MFTKYRKFQSGAGKGRAGFVGLQKVITVAVGNVGGGEDDLISTTLEAKSLYKNGQAIRITAWGSCAANANAKTLQLYFGGTSILTTGAVAANNKKWVIQAIVVRTGVDTQDVIAWGVYNDAVVATQFAALTKDDGANQTVKCTGTGTATDDIIQEGLTIEALTQ